MEDLRIKVHNKILALRSIYNTLMSDKFALCVPFAERKILDHLIHTANDAGLIEYINNLLRENNVSPSMKELRFQAKHMGIPYYAAMNKTKLIEAIKNVEKTKKPVGKVSLEQ